MRAAINTIKTEKSNIIEIWEVAVREKIPASGHTNSLALRDHVPELLEDIISILDRHENASSVDEELCKEISSSSIEHGRHRAATSFYTIDQILQEYMIFHKILVKFLRRRSALTGEVNAVLNFTIEYSMLYSSRAFNDSLQEMRQKLLGVLAHDMRNPITAALFAVDMMKSAEGERSEKLRLMANRSLKRSLDLIENLLDSVTVGAGEGMTLYYEEIDVLEIITAVYEEALEIYPGKIELENTEQEIKGIFDGTMIRRMLENLISNAIKYGKKESPVTLTVQDSDEILVLSVHNWGNPISKENQEHIFHFLKSTNGNGVKELKSWGMGLTLARAVAEAHGGKLSLKSSEREGTTFSVDLHKHKNSPGKRRTALNFR